jgi:hypothetical protein
MKYTMYMIVNKLDGTTEATTEEKDDEGKLLDAIAHTLQKHEDFASQFVFTIVADRSRLAAGSSE